MRALTVAPGIANSASVEDVPDPPRSDGTVLVRSLALGVCGTDREIVAGSYGWAPPGRKRLVIGHESLGTVEDAPVNCGFKHGDLVVGIVRRPDPVPCACCAAGEWDMCRNGLHRARIRVFNHSHRIPVASPLTSSVDGVHAVLLDSDFLNDILR